MKIFKYTLDNSSKKYVCPKCQKKTFVKYLETDTRHYLSDNFGRCDRETNCNYHNSPKGNNINTFKSSDKRQHTPSYHKMSLLTESMRAYDNNNFVSFLKTIFSSDEVNSAISQYKIGTSKNWNGSTIFWQIDNHNQIHSGKILQYNATTGKRLKDENNKALINWVHSILKRRKQLDSFNLSQCLFGLHLVNQNTKNIAIVESEKTAIMMSIFRPQYCWLATGSKQGFKEEILMPIKNHNIIAFPDKGEYIDWLNKANLMQKSGFKIFINQELEKMNCKIGVDLADLYIESMQVHNST